MSATHLILYGNDIKPASSLIGLLDGSEQFCISSPFFEVPGIPPENKTEFLSKTGESQYGIIFKAPRICARPKEGAPFVSSFKIGVAQALGIKKNFTICKPYGAANNILQKNKENLQISFGREPDSIDDKLCLISHQFACALDVLLISKILGIDLADFKDDHDNTSFYTKFCAKATEIIASKTDIEDHKLTVTQHFIDSFTNCPVYMKRDKKYGPMYQFGVPKSRMVTLMNAFYKLNADIDNSYLGDSSKLVTDSSCSIPKIMKEDYVNQKTNKHQMIVKLNGQIIIKLNEGDPGYNEKMNGMATMVKSKRGSEAPLTRSEAPTLWGGTASNTMMSNSKAYSGCLYIKPVVTVKCFKSTNNVVEWRVLSIIRNEKKFATEPTSVGDEFCDVDQEVAEKFVGKAMGGTFGANEDKFMDDDDE